MSIMGLHKIESSPQFFVLQAARCHILRQADSGMASTENDKTGLTGEEMATHQVLFKISEYLISDTLSVSFAFSTHPFVNPDLEKRKKCFF